MMRRKRWTVVALVAATVIGWAEFRDEFIPKRLVELEEDALYRSGQISARLVDRTLARLGIDTVVSLVDYNAANPEHVAERRAIERLGIRFVNVGLRGNGTGDPENYVRAIEAIARSRSRNERVLIHCSAGVRRAAGVTAMYRVLVRGDPTEEAYRELDRFSYPWGGARPAEESAILDFLNENMEEIAQGLVGRGVIAVVPEPLPKFVPPR